VGIILGGSEKHADFKKLAAHIAAQSNILAVALIGDTASRLQKDISHAGIKDSIPLKVCPDLSTALKFLIGEVRQGVILLSPACASFGLFHNYKDRGDKFKALVSKYYN
jgi:UDP-N-acetylmuramoylalanine--D-glutamate ligase